MNKLTDPIVDTGPVASVPVPTKGGRDISHFEIIKVSSQDIFSGF
jgi:hypothetical protein